MAAARVRARMGAQLDVGLFRGVGLEGRRRHRRLVAVNYAANQSQCYVRVPLQDLGERSVHFEDLMGSVGTVGFDRERSDLDAHGLYLDMPAWGYHVFDVTALDEPHSGGGLQAELSSDRAPAVQTP